ncbi:multidrug effflux MFS transporter [Chitinimonas taiwanensis]|uniref:MFS transporter, DHA1 family, 2-module integral membrane pump EmrD n=1 Tax=Chitinimonas taiwanensis DSM 18899 TaxID=1121279 RepID=A0A1K2HJ09_9NEIS|nr:multidrug effflux MFS transporter [Chitinimonas taiwanensis]SFZ76707.1 MFS transporter, DHA1 family, 2-module integral membrane pump EmrD [Chitinimonas taiwanensis DSM 18899]
MHDIHNRTAKTESDRQTKHTAPSDKASTASATPASARPTNSPLFLLWLIILLAPIGQMAIDIYVTALPEMARAFEVGRKEIQLSVSAYMIAFALGQIIYGPLCDAIGRKPALLGGIALYLFGSVVAILAGSLDWFIAGRVLQGLGITTASVVMKAIATDNFKGPQLTNTMTYMVIAWGLGPIVAPVIGAQLQVGFGWQSSLYFLFGYGVLLFGLIGFGYRESLPQAIPLKRELLVRNTAHILSDREFQLCFITMGLCYALLLTFNICAPFMVQEVLGKSPVFFGNVALSMGAAYFLGVFSNRINAGRIAPASLCRAAATASALIGPAMLLLALSRPLGLWELLLPSLLLTFLAGVIYPNLMGRGVARFPQLAGLSSSVLGCTLMVCAGLITALASLLPLDSLVPLASLYAAIALACFFTVRRLYPLNPASSLATAGAK